MSPEIPRRILAGIVIAALAALPESAVAQDAPPPAEQEGQPPQPAQPPRPADVYYPSRVQVGAGNNVIINPAGQGPAVYRAQNLVQTKPQNYLGISTRPMTGDVAAHAGELPEGVGLIISYVDPEGPAAGAGVQEHDVIVRINDQWLINPQQLTVLIRMQPEESEATLTLLRRGQEQQVQVQFETRDLPVLRAFDGNRWEMIPLAPAQGMAPQVPLRMAPMEAREAQAEARRVQVEVERIMRELEQRVGQDEAGLRRQMEELRRQTRELVQRQDVLRGLQVPQGGVQVPVGGRMVVQNNEIFGEMVVEQDEVTIRITEPEGEEIYSGPLPDEETTRELPEAAQKLVDQFRRALPPHLGGPEAPQAPAAPQDAPRREQRRPPGATQV